MEQNHYKREDQPRDINPQEVNRKDDAKEIKSQEKIDIKESGLGRDQGQTPADEHVEGISQIDKGTKKLNDEKRASEEKYDLNSKEIPEEDNRDKGDSTEDWNAQNNRSGRHKQLNNSKNFVKRSCLNVNKFFLFFWIFEIEQNTNSK